MANGPSKKGIKQEALEVQANSLMDKFERNVQAQLKGKVNPEDLETITNLFRLSLAPIAMEHLNIALYCESPQVQLAAIKEYYAICKDGFAPKNITVADKDKVTAESIIKKFMSAPTDETAADGPDKLN